MLSKSVASFRNMSSPVMERKKTNENCHTIINFQLKSSLANLSQALIAFTHEIMQLFYQALQFQSV